MREQEQAANEDRNNNLQPKHVPDSEKLQFARLFGLLLKLAGEANEFLPTFFAVVGDEAATRTMVQLYAMTNRQQQLLSSSPSPEYILDLGMVKRLLQMVLAFKNQLNNVFFQRQDDMATHLPPPDAAH